MEVLCNMRRERKNDQNKQKGVLLLRFNSFKSGVCHLQIRSMYGDIR
jgi:hypothetical protein